MPTIPERRREPAATVLRRWGDPFDADAAESGQPATEPSHVAILNRIFYDSSVDLGALVRVEGITYICTKSGWRRAPAPSTGQDAR